MENNDLGSKKKNNKQNISDEAANENLIATNPSESKMKADVETDSSGNQKIVYRAHNVDNLKSLEEGDETGGVEKPSAPLQIVPDDKMQRMVENRDHNMDVTAHRYPNSHPDNHEDKGNIKLDE